ncbi:hypothetical protein PHSY_006747 [Pseudozyma hubeiensis SY62]|uniref:Uncharacterized protein n=1 Tax=Pseudozyma hubeiensis (strain SY62) TaxID=1305764 RepID=R9PCL8_PSEHS|nr:hypothetical protein PHSY_006747 [Pseudozyma hubeiensis SY62]GAC99148.1 hypothetical protein PHSY_006747 [Pseudozyma hubeiensis SY62]
MTDLSTYLVLGAVLLPPILRQAQRLAVNARTSRNASATQHPVPGFLSYARLTPFASPFSSAVTLVAFLFLFISFHNLVPARYGFDIFIPASVLHRLRFSTHANANFAPLHIELFRGGYKPDLFLAYKAPVTIPTTTLRNLINTTPDLLPIGFLSQSSLLELQALVSRLSSYEARRMYLLLGSRPLVDCTFCKSANDFALYAVPFLLWAYAWRILGIGLLTTHPDDSVAVAIRQAASLIRLPLRSSPQPAASDAGGRSFQADRSGWRTSSLVVLTSMLVIELLVIFEFGQVTAEPSRLNHWHTNLHILRQIVAAALALVIYLFPAPGVPNTFQQSLIHLDSAQTNLQNLMHVSQLVDVTRTVVLQDDQLLDVTRRWKNSHQTSAVDIGPEKADEIIQTAMSHGGEAATNAMSQARAGVQRVTRFWWRNAELVNQQLDQQQARATSSSDDPQPP